MKNSSTSDCPLTKCTKWMLEKKGTRGPSWCPAPSTVTHSLQTITLLSIDQTKTRSEVLQNACILPYSLLAKYVLLLSVSNHSFNYECFIMLHKPLCIVADFNKLNMEVHMHFVTSQIRNRQFLLSVTVCFDRMSKHTFLVTLILLWITQNDNE